jgi:arylsulfatase A-like enzyme
VAPEALSLATPFPDGPLHAIQHAIAMPLTPTDIRFLEVLASGAWTSALVALVFTLAVFAKSLTDFTRTGPQMTDEVLSHYRLYLAFALGRLLLIAFLLSLFMAFVGGLIYVVGSTLFDSRFSTVACAAFAAAAIVALTGRRLAHTLLFSPGVIAASSLYSTTHLLPLWDRLTPERLRALDLTLLGVLGIWLIAGAVTLARDGGWVAAASLIALALLYLAIVRAATSTREPAPVRPSGKTPERPNILLIGSDTLRADRLNGMGYRRSLTPNLEKVIARGTLFTDCYVPCARTAPSVVSMLTGTWPHRNRIRDTFVTPEETRLPVPSLPGILKPAGYRSAIVGDWAASDAEKFDFGFDHHDLPRDQWNIKYLLKQGPKDLRLFISLFTQNRFGKTFLPEVYYLGGIPLTEEVGLDTRRMIARLASDDSPFFIMSFMATTHPPFTSKYPYYSLYSDPAYRGESKFIMAKLRDPWEIIRRQGEPKSEFDLEQIIDLYDGCVRNFDDEVARILEYVEASGLAQNTIVVVFSDHGFEFFEHETWGQGNSAIGDFSARVPIIVADPRIPQPEKVSDVVRTVDIAPTLLDLVGLPIPQSVEGVSLAPLLRGERLASELPAFYETGVWLTDLPGTPDDHLRYPELPELLEIPDKQNGMIALKRKYLDIVVAAKDRMVRRGKWKLSYQPLTNGVVYRLFDIERDPGCQNNIIDRYPEVARELRVLLERWLEDDPIRANGSVAPATRQGACVT